MYKSSLLFLQVNGQLSYFNNYSELDPLFWAINDPFHNNNTCAIDVNDLREFEEFENLQNRVVYSKYDSFSYKFRSAMENDLFPVDEKYALSSLTKESMDDFNLRYSNDIIVAFHNNSYVQTIHSYLFPVWTFVFSTYLIEKLFEVFLVVFVLAGAYNFISSKLSNAKKIKEQCENMGISYYELVGFSTVFILLVLIDMLASFTDNDIPDMSFALVILVISGTLISLIKNLGTIKLYGYLTSVSNNESFKKLIINDLTNFSLCLLRVIMCLIRFVFYDIQVENVDMVLHYSENIGNDSKIESYLYSSFFSYTVYVIFDIFVYSIQILINVFKYGIATFLLWLILDLILIRVDGAYTQLWLIYKNKKKLYKIIFKKKK